MTEFELKFANVEPVLNQEKNVTVRHDMEYVPKPDDKMLVLDQDGNHRATVNVRVVAHTKLSYAYKTAQALGKYTDDNRKTWLERMRDYYGPIGAGEPVYAIKFYL